MKGFGLVWALATGAMLLWNSMDASAQSVPVREATLGEQNRSLQSTANRYNPYRFLDQVKGEQATQQSAEFKRLSEQSGIPVEGLKDLAESFLIAQKAMEAADGDYEKAMQYIELYFKGEWKP